MFTEMTKPSIATFVIVICAITSTTFANAGTKRAMHHKICPPSILGAQFLFDLGFGKPTHQFVYCAEPIFRRLLVSDWLSRVRRYNGIIMRVMAPQITSLTTVYLAVYSGEYQRKHQSSAPLASVREIHRSPVKSPHKRPVTRKMFPFDDVVMAHFQTDHSLGYHKTCFVYSTSNSISMNNIFVKATKCRTISWPQVKGLFFNKPLIEWTWNLLINYLSWIFIVVFIGKIRKLMKCFEK